MNVDKVILAGNLTHDPEVRHTSKGACVTNIALALSRKWKNPEGEYMEAKVFFEVVIFGKLAEICAHALRKGSPIMIEGRHEMQMWTDKETGQKRSKLVIVGEHAHFSNAHRRDEA